MISYRDGIHMLRLALVRAQCDIEGSTAFITRVICDTDHLMDPALEDSVPIPRNADQAQLMANLGLDYLKQHAPERLHPTK